MNLIYYSLSKILDKIKKNKDQYSEKDVKKMTENSFSLFDTHKNEKFLINGDSLSNEFDKIKNFFKDVIQKSKLEGFELEEFTASLGIKSGVWMFEANGGIELTWKKKK